MEIIAFIFLNWMCGILAAIVVVGVVVGEDMGDNYILWLVASITGPIPWLVFSLGGALQDRYDREHQL